MTNDRYLLICNTSDGLIAQINGVVAQLQLARRLGLMPIVYLHARSNMFGGPNPYFDAGQGDNVWDYYLEPIGASGAELDRLVADGKVVTLSTASELQRLFRWEPESWFMNPFGYYRSVENHADGPYPARWWQAQRDHARAFLSDGTIRFHRSILAQVDAFAQARFADHTLGLQLRGSDKFDFGVGPNLSRKVVPEEYFPYIDRYLAEHPDCTRIFVATDQRQWLKVLEAAYPDHVISYSEMSLSESDDNNFNKADKKAARGAEALVDTLLLARCQHVFKCHAAVGEMALVLNPTLTFVDLNYAEQPMVARGRAARSLAAPLIWLLARLWRGLAQGGLALEPVLSIDGSDIIVGHGRGRPLNTRSGATEFAARAPMSSKRFMSDAFDYVLRALSNRCFRYAPRRGEGETA